MRSKQENYNLFHFYAKSKKKEWKIRKKFRLVMKTFFETRMVDFSYSLNIQLKLWKQIFLQHLLRIMQANLHIFRKILYVIEHAHRFQFEFELVIEIHLGTRKKLFWLLSLYYVLPISPAIWNQSIEWKSF